MSKKKQKGHFDQAPTDLTSKTKGVKRKEYVTRDLRALVEQSKERIRLYQLIFTRLLTAHRCYDGFAMMRPDKRIIKRVRYYAKRLYLERERNLELQATLRDCEGNSIAEREALTAMNLKHGTPGWGAGSGFDPRKDRTSMAAKDIVVVNRQDTDEVNRYNAKRMRRAYQRQRRKLSLFNYAAMTEEVPKPPDDRKEQAKILMGLIAEMREVACAAHTDFLNIDLEARAKKRIRIADKRRITELKNECFQILLDMEALGCNLESYMGCWTTELINKMKTTPRVGRPRTKERPE